MGSMGRSRSKPILKAIPLTGWEIAYSVGMPRTPDGAWDIDIPSVVNPDKCAKRKHSCKSVHYVWKNVQGRIKNNSTLTMEFTVIAPKVQSWNYKLEPTNNGNHPASVAFIMQRKGDDMRGANGRFWATSRAVLEHGNRVLKIKINRHNFINVLGKKPSISVWNSMLANLGRVGVTFGGGSFYGHGVNVTGGTAKFKMERFRFD